MKILIIIPAKTMHILTCKEKKISKAHHHQKDNSLRPPPPLQTSKKNLVFHPSQIIFIGIAIAVEQECT